jgi:hypothetical protein
MRLQAALESLHDAPVAMTFKVSGDNLSFTEYAFPVKAVDDLPRADVFFD